MEKVIKLRLWVCLVACLFAISIGVLFIYLFFDVGRGKEFLSVGLLWLVAGGLPFLLLLKCFYKDKINKGGEMMVMTVGEKLERQRQKRRIKRGLLQFLAIMGMSPVLAYGFLGWLSPDPIFINWPLCYDGLGLTIVSWLALKYLWI